MTDAVGFAAELRRRDRFDESPCDGPSRGWQTLARSSESALWLSIGRRRSSEVPRELFVNADRALTPQSAYLGF